MDENIQETPVEGVQAALDEAAPLTEQVETKVYQVVGDSKIPVSKHLGKMWEGRRKAAENRVQSLRTGWEEAVKYYNHDQFGHRTTEQTEKSGNNKTARRRNETWSETENVIFSSVNAMVPALYAKNPSAEISVQIPTKDGEEDDKSEFARACEKLVNILAARKDTPGVNLKPKAKQAVILASLTNGAWMEVGYTIKQYSSDAALTELNQLATELAEAADQNVIQEIEGKLMALEDTFDFLRPSGPYLRLRDPRAVLVDPDSNEPDHSDALWMMYEEYIPTAYLKARYAAKQENGKYASIYDPTHVLDGSSSTNGVEEQINNFRLLTSSDTQPGSYGYETQEQLLRAFRTKCWMVWDKVTRRVFLFNDKDWSMPIWVWDDPYKLPTFFPLEKLSYTTAPVGAHSKSEVTYVLDQQDAINDINDETKRIRVSRNNILYNSNAISQEDFNAWAKGPDGTARGIALPDGSKMSDHVFLGVPPSAQLLNFFLQDYDRKMQAIDRTLGVNEALRGGQFKTNTTNDAVQAYQQQSNIRRDEKVDAVEDWIGSILEKVLMLCYKYMTKDEVTKLIGAELAQRWTNGEPSEIAALNLRIVGGSTQKPTSGAKKQEALQLGQVLGQFARATPAAIEVVLRVMQRAFDEISITKEDWQFIRQSVAQQLQQGAPAGGGGGGTAGGGAPPEQQVFAVLDQLPPQLKKAFALAILQGVPAAEALQQIIAAAQGGQQAAA